MNIRCNDNSHFFFSCILFNIANEILECFCLFKSIEEEET